MGGLFQTLLLDDVKWDGVRMIANLYVIYTINYVK